MRKTIVLLFFLIISSLNLFAESDYLKTFFDGKTYLTESYKFDNTNILYSYIFADNSTDIVTKALIVYNKVRNLG
jgi:hypothetical protein